MTLTSVSNNIGNQTTICTICQKNISENDEVISSCNQIWHKICNEKKHEQQQNNTPRLSEKVSVLPMKPNSDLVDAFFGSIEIGVVKLPLRALCWASKSFAKCVKDECDGEDARGGYKYLSNAASFVSTAFLALAAYSVLSGAGAELYSRIKQIKIPHNKG